MDEFIFEAIAKAGFLGVFLLMALENIVPPIPSEVIMGISGVLVAQGQFAFWPLLLVATTGTTAGNMVWYWLGHRYGYERLRPFVDRYGRWLTLSWRDIERAQRYFSRHGPWIVFAFRFSPFMRTIISLPAGLVHMRLVPFLLVTYCGSLIWNGLLIKGGAFLGETFAQSQEWLAVLLLAFLGAGLAFYLYRIITWQPHDEDDD